MTYHNIYMDARAQLKRRDEQTAALEARFLLMAASGKTHEELLRDSALYAPPDVRKLFRDMLDKRLNGQPLAYVTGSWNFYGLPLSITPDVLIPRVDTEVLAEAAIEYAKDGRRRVLDLCTGSGCVALAVAKNVPEAQVTMVDIDEAALQVARRNARDLNLRVTAVRTDILSPPPTSEFDLITCNPPYIPTKDYEALDSDVRDHEPRRALDGGADGLVFYRSLATLWQKALKPDGVMMVELGAGACRTVREIFLLAGFSIFKVLRDTGGIDRVLIAKL